MIETEPHYPAWLPTHLNKQATFIQSLDPYPFSQPLDTTGYYSLHLNDYLRLANHRDVIATRTEAAARTGGDSYSSVYGGDTPDVENLISQIRCSMQASNVFLTSTGWSANVGLIEAITVPGIPIYIDLEAHASLHDGIRMSTGRRVLCRHNDTMYLEEKIALHGPGIVIIDALYSSDGSLADLPHYVDICKRNDCVLVVDEAHSFGMFGSKGGGLVVEQGLVNQVHFRTVSLSKALGGHGGAVACGNEIATGLWCSLRTVIFSSATSPILAAANGKALQLAIQEQHRAKHTLAMAELLRRHLNAAGIDTLGSRSQIVSLKFAGTGAVRLYGALRERKILGSIFIYPAVPKNVSLLRFSLHAEISASDITFIAASIVDCLELLGLKGS